MDCYSGRNFEELVVPNYNESSDTYQSSGMWGGWTMNSPEATEKCFVSDDYDVINNGFSGGLYSQMGMGTNEEESKRLKSCDGDFYRASSLHNFQGIEQIDDIFLSSILEDVPGNGNGDLQCGSSSNNSVSCSSSLGGREVPMFQQIGLRHVMPFKLKEEAPFTISDMSEENMLELNYEEELSSEELVLQDLQRATEKLTDETRKCFRDTFYRLARNSNEKSDSGSTNSEEFFVQTSRYDYGERISCRLNRDEETESETNSIDRAIANLTFNKMESNISKYPLPERLQ